MTLLIQKFGGTSLGSIEHIQRAAKLVTAACQNGYQVIVVVSAMSGETDRLSMLSGSITQEKYPREYAALLASGEQISAALFAMALNALAVSAKSYGGFQIGLRTSNTFCNAHIKEVDRIKLQHDLSLGIVPVVTGFQGINDADEITTLGRGGSDMTAVALAGLMNARECQIFTDVEGVYSADPHLVAEAHLIERLTYDEMLAYADLGAKVLQGPAVEFARKYQVPLRVLASASGGITGGTLVAPAFPNVSAPKVSGIACISHQVKVTLSDLSAAAVRRLLAHIGQEAIEMDMFCKHQKSVNTWDVSFSLHEQDLPDLCRLTSDLHVQSGMAKLSLVGQSMRAHAGFSAKIMQLLSSHDILIHSIISTESKVSILLPISAIQSAANHLHTEFKVAFQECALISA